MKLSPFYTGYSAPVTLHKHRRSTSPKLPSSLPHSSLHALLLDCLANAGAEESFPPLAHHTTFRDLSVRHAALRAMGSYDTDEVSQYNSATLCILHTNTHHTHPHICTHNTLHTLRVLKFCCPLLSQVPALPTITLSPEQLSLSTKHTHEESENCQMHQMNQSKLVYRV